MPLAVGDTFLAPESGRATEHLWVVLAVSGADAIIVSITTQWPDSDSTCVLLPGDHPFVKHASVVYYEGARRVPSAAVEAALAAGATSFVFESRPRCSVPLLTRIRAGFLESPAVTQELKDVCRRLWSQD